MRTNLQSVLGRVVAGCLRASLGLILIGAGATTARSQLLVPSYQVSVPTLTNTPASGSNLQDHVLWVDANWPTNVSVSERYLTDSNGSLRGVTYPEYQAGQAKVTSDLNAAVSDLTTNTVPTLITTAYLDNVEGEYVSTNKLAELFGFNANTGTYIRPRSICYSVVRDHFTQGYQNLTSGAWSRVTGYTFNNGSATSLWASGTLVAGGDTFAMPLEGWWWVDSWLQVQSASGAGLQEYNWADLFVVPNEALNTPPQPAAGSSNYIQFLVGETHLYGGTTFRPFYMIGRGMAVYSDGDTTFQYYTSNHMGNVQGYDTENQHRIVNGGAGVYYLGR